MKDSEKKKIKAKHKVRLVTDTNGSGLIIKFRGGISEAVKLFNKKNKLRKLIPVDKPGHTYLGWFPKMTLAQLRKLGKTYYKSGFALFAEPHVEHNVTPAFLDPKYKDQWIMNNTGQSGGKPGVDIRIEQALQYIAANGISPRRDITVAVLDEGVDIDHKDFPNDLWVSNFSVFGNGKNPRPSIGDHHGTNVTGIISATQNNGIGIAGINPYCKIMAGRLYFSANGGLAKPLDIGKGIRRAIDSGARVINMSFQIPWNSFVADTIAYGASKNVVFCGCAGNFSSAANHSVTFPGRLDDVICVGAMDNRGEWIGLTNTNSPGQGSCYGREVDIVAPGVLLATTQNGNQYTDSFGGTSGACAIVSAIAALVLAVNPNLTALQVRDILLSTADPMPAYDAEHVGHGKVNALKAVQRAVELMVV